MSGAGRSGGKGVDPRWMRGIRYGFASFSMLQADSSLGGEESRNANQIISGRGEDEKPFNQVAAAMPGFAQSPNGLHPSERFFDPLAGGQADAIAGMTGGASVDRRSAMRVVLRHMRRAAAFAASGDKVGGVVILVGSHRAARVGIVLDHAEGGGTLSCAIGFGQLSSFLHPREVDGT